MPCTEACDGVRRPATSGGYYIHRKIASRHETLTADGSPGPSEASDVRADDGGETSVVSDGANVAAMVKSC